MGFLNNDGLRYFYQKLKDKFVATVNGQTPEDGEVTITNVATADNLNSLDSIIDYDSYIARTSAGVQNINSGVAYLSYIEGQMIYEGRGDESISLSGTNGITGTVNLAVWTTEISEEGEYEFSYAPGTLSSSVSNQEEVYGTWDPSLDVYGITVQNVIPKTMSITCSNSSTTAAVSPSTFINYVHPLDNEVHTFTSYIEESIDEQGVITRTQKWIYNNNEVTLNNYGITTTSTFNSGDTITVIYNSGTPASEITVSYQPESRGTIHIPKPTSFVSTGFNQFNPDDSTKIIENATITSGVIVAGTGYVCFVKAVPGSTQGYIAYSEGEHLVSEGIGWCSTVPEIGTELDQTRQDFDVRSTELASITFSEIGYIAVAVDDYSDLCIHTRWDSEDDTTYEEYSEPSVIVFPTQGTVDDDPTLVDLPLADYGMPAIGNVRDKLDLDGSTYIQKIGRLENNSTNMNTVIEYGTNYDYDDNYIYFILKDKNTAEPGEPYITYYNLAISTSEYLVNDFGTEEFIGTSYPVMAEAIYGENLRNKLKTDVLMISQQNPAFTQSQINSVRKNLLDIIYPIGSIYTSTSSTSPEVLWGGKWTQIQGRFLIGANATYLANTSGGNSTHTHTTGNFTLQETHIPSHNHSTASSGRAFLTVDQDIAVTRSNVQSGSGVTHVLRYPDTSGGVTREVYTGKKGGGSAHNHGSTGSTSSLPPYYSVYMWRRINDDGTDPTI